MNIQRFFNSKTHLDELAPVAKGGPTIMKKTAPTSRAKRSLRLAPVVALLAGAALLPLSASVKAQTLSDLLGIPGSGVLSSPIANNAECSLTGTTRACPLFATAGITGGGMAVWSFGLTSAAPTLPAGPTIVAVQGETLALSLTNQVPGTSVSLSILGLDKAQDVTGVATGANKLYNFANVQPGTYLYEAGPTADGPRQQAMGLVGALIVRPSVTINAPYANGDTTQIFTEESVVLLGEIDPLFHANPLTYNMVNYKPTIQTINGKTFPATDTINTQWGHTVAVRYLNAGTQNHAMSITNVRQKIVGHDGHALATPKSVENELLTPGQTAEAVVATPTTSIGNIKYALYDAAMRTSDGNTSNSAMTVINAACPSAVPLNCVAPVGAPKSSGLTVARTTAPLDTPAVYHGAADILAVKLHAVVGAGNTTGTVQAAEYFVDKVGTVGTGLPFAGTFGTAAVDVTATLTAANLSALTDGTYTVWARAKDSSNNWGSLTGTSIVIDQQGANVGAIEVTPTPTNGLASPDADSMVAVLIHATATSSSLGSSTVSAVEYFIGVPGANGSGHAMAIDPLQSITSAIGKITKAEALLMVDGVYTLSFHAQDSNGTWSRNLDNSPAYTTATLTIDHTGPVATFTSLSPNPNNGYQSYAGSTGFLDAVRLTASATDALSNVVAGEAFIVTTQTPAPSTPADNGKGAAFFSADTVWNSKTKEMYVELPLAAIRTFGDGVYTIMFHAKDAAGNWGAYASTTLTINRNLMSIQAINLDATGALTVTVTAGLGVGDASYTIAGSPTVHPLLGTYNQPIGILSDTLAALPPSGTVITVTAHDKPNTHVATATVVMP